MIFWKKKEKEKERNFFKIQRSYQKKIVSEGGKEKFQMKKLHVPSYPIGTLESNERLIVIEI